MKKGKITRDAVEILNHRWSKDPEYKKLYEDEKIKFDAALAIRSARECSGLTQAQLAKLIGTTQSVISRLEDADYEGHTLKMLARIAGALNGHLEINLKLEKQTKAA